MAQLHRIRLLLTLSLSVAPLTGSVYAAPQSTGAISPSRLTVPPGVRQGPLPAGEKAAWTHAPFAAGDCSICHERADAKNPGRVMAAGNEVCLGCHEEFQAILSRRHPHPPAKVRCVACHNAHDAKQAKLLHLEAGTLCLGCHPDVKETSQKARVKHAAVGEGRKCLNCHDPHGSSVEKLLTMLPFDLCVSCHSKDGLKDGRGVSLTNFGKLLSENKEWHAPVAAKDCSACHQPHGSDHFRLLVADYPASFYAPYDPKNYELCFTCHNADVAKEPETLTLTGFRDGSRNLHYVHVHKVDRGRTCRACHEVHASKQAHQIRDGVPYGTSGWTLKVGYTKTQNGGSCAKTCHDTKTYDRKSPAASLGPK